MCIDSANRQSRCLASLAPIRRTVWDVWRTEWALILDCEAMSSRSHQPTYHGPCYRITPLAIDWNRPALGRAARLSLSALAYSMTGDDDACAYRG